MCKYISQILLLVFFTLFIAHSQIYYWPLIKQPPLYSATLTNVEYFQMSLQVFLNSRIYWYFTSFWTIWHAISWKFLYKILLCVPVQTYVKMSSNAGWRNTMVIMWLVLGWRESCPGFCASCSFLHSDYGFMENKFFPRMYSKQIRILCNVGYKFNVIRHANEQDNRTAERLFDHLQQRK